MPPNTARQGVEVRLNEGVRAVLGEAQGRVTGVTLESGEEIPCDMVVAGIGIVPAVAPLIAAGGRRLQRRPMSISAVAPHWTTSTPSAIAPRTPILTPIMP